jgi:hypothetical protein
MRNAALREGFLASVALAVFFGFAGFTCITILGVARQAGIPH